MTEKGKFLEKINQAYASGDTEYIIQNVTDDIQWTVHGDFSVSGKKDFIEGMKKMAGAGSFEIEIENIITHGTSASVNGIMKSGENYTFAFCDVYKFSGFKNPKIKEISSYVIPIKE